MSFNSNDLLIKPTYDVAFYGQDVVIPLTTDTLALQAITWSNLDALTQSNDTFADSHIEPYSRAISDIDTWGILNEGDGVRFSRNYEWLSDMSAWVYKFDVTFAIGLSVTAFTSGVHSVDSVRLIIQELNQGGGLVKEIFNAISTTAMGDQGVAGDRVAIVHFEGNTPFKVGEGNRVTFNIIFTSTDTGTATTFEGIMPYFYAQEGATAKTLLESAITLHLHPSLDHAQIVLRDESAQEGLDYSGVTRQNFERGIKGTIAPLPEPPDPIPPPIITDPTDHNKDHHPTLVEFYK